MRTCYFWSQVENISGTKKRLHCTWCNDNTHSACISHLVEDFPSSYLSGPGFNIKMPSYQYRKSHCWDKTILRPSYLNNGISHTGKTTSLYWIRAQNSMIMSLLVWRISLRSSHHNLGIWWHHGMEMLSTLPAICEENPPVTIRFGVSFLLAETRFWTNKSQFGGDLIRRPFPLFIAFNSVFCWNDLQITSLIRESKSSLENIMLFSTSLQSCELSFS